jgi:hypothetical protein
MGQAVRQDFEQHLLTMLRHRPAIHLPSVVRLHALCQQQLVHETNSAWMTFWTLASRYFSGLRRSSEQREFSAAEASAASQIMSGILLREQFDEQVVEGLQDLELVNQLLFLEQADVLAQRLEALLHECAEQPEHWPDNLPDDARNMALLAQDISLSAVQQVADALAAQLARLRVNRVVDDIRASLQATQEVTRLLHQFAAGSIQTPQPHVLEALRASH